MFNNSSLGHCHVEGVVQGCGHVLVFGILLYSDEHSRIAVETSASLSIKHLVGIQDTS